MRYVVIGSSAAGCNAVRELRKIDSDATIVLISKDQDIYSRCILHEYLSGKRTIERLKFVEKDFETLYNVYWIKGREVTGLDRAAKEVILENADRIAYDKLLIATGSHTFVPPIPGLAGAKNFIGFRNIDDIEVLKEVPKTCKNIVVLGSGLVGIDCTCGYLEMGVKVTLVDFAGWLLNRQLDQRAAQTYIDKFASLGIDQHYGVGVSELKQNEDGYITNVILTDGTDLPCDYFVITAGVRSNVEFLKDSGLELSKFGLIYDEKGQTNDPDIYGAGDVSGTSPIWPVAVKEGMIAAANMAGGNTAMTDFFASKSTMTFCGIHTMSLGTVTPPEGEEGYDVVTYEKGDVYKKIVTKDGVIVGAIMQGDLAYGGVLQQLIARKIDIRRVKKPIFEVDYSDFFHITDNNYQFYYEEN